MIIHSSGRSLRLLALLGTLLATLATLPLLLLLPLWLQMSARNNSIHYRRMYIYIYLFINVCIPSLKAPTAKPSCE